MAETIADAAIATAAAWVLAGKRVDIGELARAVGVNRSTLHRRVGDRAAVVGEALWSLTVQALETATAAAAADDDGGPASPKIASVYLDLVAEGRGLRRLLDDEPDFAIRVLTAPDGCVQPRLITAVTAILDADVARGRLKPPLPTPDLAYAIVRLGEAFLYADILSSRPPDVEAAKRLIGALLEPGVVPAR